MLKTKLYRGFTIVELLVVIVIIGVLASITVVAYNGIQSRAKNQAYSSAVDGWEKLFSLEYASTGRIPGADGVTTRCLGDSINNFPATSDFALGECERIVGSPDTVSVYDQTFINQFEQASNFPNGLLPVFKYTDQSGANVKSRGVIAFVGTNGSSYEVRLYWKMTGKNQCARGTDGLAETSYPISSCERVLTFN